MEYHKTKDILHVKEILGHKSINNTILYTQLVTIQTMTILLHELLTQKKKPAN